MEKNNNNDYVSVIAIIIIILMVLYLIFIIYKNTKELNSNEISNNVYNIANDNDIAINSFDDNVIAQREITYTEIASYTTTLYDNQENRIYNISKACGILNDTIIKKDEEFSFNNTIGPMGEDNGFKLATGFDSNGKLIQIPGGGMCQLSSTLYNAALLVNLEITERHAHSRRVSYVPQDKDATIYYPSLDLKFINNTENDIKVYAECDNYNVTIKLYKIEQSN